MSKFNLEAAKRGGAVQIFGNDNWIDTHFVGLTRTGTYAVFQGNVNLYSDLRLLPIDSEKIRMKPKQREMWCFPYWSGGSLFISSPQYTKENAEKGAAAFVINVVAGPVQMILVDEE